MLTTKQKIIYIAAAILVVIAIAIGTVFILKSINVATSSTQKNQNNTTPVTTETIVTQAVQSLHSDPAKAKTLLEQAKLQYQASGDTAGVVNVEAQLYLLAHPPKATK